MKPALYIFVRKDLGMSTGKVCAQVAQATAVIVEAEKMRWITHQWLYRGGHHMTLVMEVSDERALRATQEYLRERGFESFMQLDEGHTEVDPLTPTVLAVQPVNKDDPHVAATFSLFKLYRDPRPAPTRRKRIARCLRRYSTGNWNDTRGQSRE
jgi:peptidyl-tRNA hydrolase